MNIINNTFSTSVNIKRDLDNDDIYYLTTANAEQAFETIIHQFVTTNQHAFKIIGAYGSGKSSFLWAVEKTLNRKKDFFPLHNLSLKHFEVLPLVGEFQSLSAYFAEMLGMSPRNIRGKDIIEKLQLHYNEIEAQGKGLLILIDEFGKFLEYAAQHDTEHELYFVQQLAEFVNDKNILLITTLHQGLSAYFTNLSESKRNEWRKVEGRLTEITFNEPVEQLLSLAAKKLSEHNFKIPHKKSFETLFKSIKTAFPTILRDYYSLTIAENLYPFDILSAAVLTLSLQRYGQNERSLFSFLASNDYLSFYDWQEKGLYSVVNSYDYLFHNFHSFLSTKYNPDYGDWAVIRAALHRIENYFFAGHITETEYDDACKLLKTIGLTNILYPNTGSLALDFLQDYGKFSLMLSHSAADILAILEKYKIIRYRHFANRYVLHAGSDIDIDKELQKAKENLQDDIDFLKRLDDYFNLSYISAKQVTFQYGTPRIFSYLTSEFPISSFALQGEIDGYINLIFSDKTSEKELQRISQNCTEAILFALYKNTAEIKELVKDIEIIKKVKQENSDEGVVFLELSLLQEHHTNLLNQVVVNSLYQNNDTISWYFQGQKINIDSFKNFNRELSRICEIIYPQTPIYRNEMVNKTKISGAISTARNAFLLRLVENYHEFDFGFAEAAFPPEKTIYYSLLKDTGIHIASEGVYALQAPTEPSFAPLWEAGKAFLEATKSNRRSIAELIDLFSAPPFKLKKGFIEFWLPTFLFIHRDDFALFLDDGYVANLTNDILERILKTPDDFEIKMFDVEGVKLDVFNSYRTLMNKSQAENINNQSFIETIRPFLTFYRGLDEYAKKTRSFSKHTLALRNAIALAKDPEKTFFEDFPTALGFSIIELRDNPEELENFAFQLQHAIREIRTGYDALVDRVEIFLNETIQAQLDVPNTLQSLDYPENKRFLQSYFKPIKKHLLLPHHNIFYQRVIANIDERKSWIAALAQACLNKQLNQIQDDDEFRLKDRLTAILSELDGLRTLSKENIEEDEEIFEISALSVNFKQKLRISKQKLADNDHITKKIEKALTKDNKLNAAILANLLSEILKK